MGALVSIYGHMLLVYLTLATVSITVLVLLVEQILQHLLAHIILVNLAMEQVHPLILIHTSYLSDVLWDGAGCSAGNACCSNAILPWFYHHTTVATKDDIEVRLCTDQSFSNEAVLVTYLELYVQQLKAANLLYNTVCIYVFIMHDIDIIISSSVAVSGMTQNKC